jgi:hypothetical protein
MWTDPDEVAAQVYRKGGMHEYRRWAVMNRGAIGGLMVKWEGEIALSEKEESSRG